MGACLLLSRVARQLWAGMQASKNVSKLQSEVQTWVSLVIQSRELEYLVADFGRRYRGYEVIRVGPGPPLERGWLRRVVPDRALPHCLTR